MRILRLQNQLIQKNNDLRLGIYEDLQSGILSREEFMTLKEEFSARIAAAKLVIEQLNSSKSEIQHGLSRQRAGFLSSVNMRMLRPLRDALL